MLEMTRQRTRYDDGTSYKPLHNGPGVLTRMARGCGGRKGQNTYIFNKKQHKLAI